MNSTALVIADADAIVAFANADDANHVRARKISHYLDEHHIRILFPTTAIIEAVTVMQRKLTKPHIAAFIIERVKAGSIPLQAVDEHILTEAAPLFNPHGSKQNTLFDAVIATIAKQTKADAIFSFDGWYRKIGLVLVDDLLATQKYTS